MKRLLRILLIVVAANSVCFLKGCSRENITMTAGFPLSYCELNVRQPPDPDQDVLHLTLPDRIGSFSVLPLLFNVGATVCLYTLLPRFQSAADKVLVSLLAAWGLFNSFLVCGFVWGWCVFMPILWLSTEMGWILGSTSDLSAASAAGRIYLVLVIGVLHLFAWAAISLFHRLRGRRVLR